VLSVVVGSVSLVVDSVVVDSVVVSVEVVSSAVVVSVDDSVDVAVDSVVASVGVESDNTASGPAPATTPDVTSPAVNIAASTKTIRSRCRPREAAVRPFISPYPLSCPPQMRRPHAAVASFASTDSKSTAQRS
jgi:hypothetical protein